MNINNIPSNHIDKTSDAHATRRTGADQRAAKAHGSQRTAEDSVTITDTAQRLRDLQTQVDAAPVTNQAKIDRIRGALQAGAYKVDAQSVASKIFHAEISG